MDTARRWFSRDILIQGGVGETATPVSGMPADEQPPLRIEERLFREMIERLEDVLPNEGCGLIAFDDDRPVKVYPGTNVLHSASRYRMSDVEVLRAVDDMDRHGWWLGAIYHSHPSSSPVPSATDLREANWPDALMIIVSLATEVPEARAYRLAGGGEAFVEVPIEVYSQRLPWLSSIRRQGFGRSSRSPERRASRRVVWQPIGFGNPFAATRGSEQSEQLADLPASARVAPPEQADEPERRAVIGILGGMGPLATADLYRKIIENTPAVNDQDHIPVVMYADPRVPDRTEALLREGEDPTPWLVRGARALVDMGADFIVIPCNTAHAFLESVQPVIDRPILSMIEAAAGEIRDRHPEAAIVGLLATSGTIASEMYQRALIDRGFDVIVPDDDVQRRCVMAAIREVKAGRAGRAATALLVEAGEDLARRGADVLLAACTEIPVVFQQTHTTTPLVDATAALARAAVTTALHLDAAARSGSPQWETSTTGWDVSQVRAADG